MTPAPSSAFGLTLYPHFALPGLAPRSSPTETPRVELRAVDQEQLRSLWSGSVGKPVWETVLGPGADYALLSGIEADHLIRYQGAPCFHLSPDGAVLSCAEPGGRDPQWTRTLLDTVLWSVALLRGVALLHAGAVLAPGGVVAIVGAQGAGKSSLVGQLLNEGWPLFTDDILAYGVDGERIVGHPGPALMNLSTHPGAVPDPLSVGRILARFEDEAGSPEAWVALDQQPPAPQPLLGLVLLTRAGESHDVQLSVMTDALLDVIPHTLAFRALPGAQRARFEAASDLVARVPVFCVNAGLSVTPAELAATLRSELDSAIEQASPH